MGSCTGEEQIRDEEADSPDHERMPDAPRVAQVSTRQARERRSDVVRDVQRDRDLRRGFLTTRRLEEFGRTKDHQRGSRVPNLERSDPDEEATEGSPEDGADPELDRATRPAVRDLDVARGEGDREGSREPWDDGQDDRGPDADERHQEQSQQGTEDRPEVVHHPLESERAPEGTGIGEIREQRVARGTAEPPSGPRSGAQDRRPAAATWPGRSRSTGRRSWRSHRRRRCDDGEDRPPARRRPAWQPRPRRPPRPRSLPTRLREPPRSR